MSTPLFRGLVSACHRNRAYDVRCCDAKRCRAWGAWLRGDLDLVLVRFAPDFQYEPPHEWLLPGMQSVYQGHAGLREWTADMREAWEWTDNTPLEVVDRGDVLLFLNQVRLRARGSGVEFDSRFGFVI